MGSIMLLILIKLICIGNNEGIPNELQADSSRSIPHEQRFNPLITGQVAKVVCVCGGEREVASPLVSSWRNEIEVEKGWKKAA